MLPGQETPRELIRRAYAAFNSRDLDSALAAMHPDVDWPNAITGGRVRGHGEIRRYWSRQLQLFDPWVEPRSVSMDLRGRIVVDVRQVVRDLQGTVLADEPVQHVYTIRDGLIACMDIRQTSGKETHAEGHEASA
jgi:hypothetical protein